MTMRICVVGNGPSAEGKGKQIDACDFVVRLRNWWKCAAEHAGRKINAHAYFGWWDDDEQCPWKGFEHWFTHCPEQLKAEGAIGWRRVDYVNQRARGQPIRWLTSARWNQLRGALKGEHPSTGIVAIAMALDRFYSTDIELWLYGFDSTTPDRPKFFDAREGNKKSQAYHVCHDILAEKRLIAAIGNAPWVTGKKNVKLVWPDKPDF